MSERVENFLRQHGWESAARTPIAAGASTRAYTRLLKPGHAPILLMDAGAAKPLPPHPYEQTIMPDLAPFVRVQGLLKNLGLRVPEIYAVSPAYDMLLVEDFGEYELERLLKNGAPPLPLLTLAVDTLTLLQEKFAAAKPDMTGLRHYSPDFFLSHLAVIPEVYMPLLCGAAPSSSARADFDRHWHAVLTRACATPHSLMLRDFSVSNTFCLPGNICALIDFETAGTGPVIYDLVSMLRANRYKVPADITSACIARFRTVFPALDDEEFDAAYNILGTMRQVQWAGSCALYTTQGRSGFLDKLPGIWTIIEGTLNHSSMRELKAWFDQHIPSTARMGKVTV